MPAARESAAARSAAGLRDQAAWPRSALAIASSTCCAVASWAWATMRVGWDGSTEANRRPSHDVLADQHRDLERQLGVERGERGQRLAADGLAAQLEQRFVAERGHGASRSSAVVGAAGVRGEEGVVGGVLEQAAHEVGHARDEVADRAVAAHAPAGRRDRGLRVVARARAGSGTRARRCRPGGRRRRPRRRRSSAGCGSAIATRIGAGVVDQDLGERLEVAVALAAVGEDRRRPAVLGGLDDLVVPVGALDQPDRERVLARRRLRPSRSARRGTRANRRGRPAGRCRRDGPSANSGWDSRSSVRRVIASRVSKDSMSTCRWAPDVAGDAQQVAQARSRALDPALGRLGAQQRRERGDLDGQVDVAVRARLGGGRRACAARPRSAACSGRPRPRRPWPRRAGRRWRRRRSSTAPVIVRRASPWRRRRR